MRATAFILVSSLILAACIPPPPEPAPLRAVELVPPDRWPDLADDLDAGSLARAGERSIAYLEGQGDRLYELGGRTVGAPLLIDTIRELTRIRGESSGEELLSRLKAGFRLYHVRRSTAPLSAHFSSYYQPVIRANRERTPVFKYPLYSKPPDLVSVDLGRFDRKLKGKSVVGRVDGEGRFVPYFDRRDIDIRGELEGKGLEIAWLKSQYDRLNIHIQGSGLLRFPDGSEVMAAFAATNARPYTSVGLSVVGSGALTREELTAMGLKKYLQEHPEGEAWLLSRNPRYTFFKLTPLPEGGEPAGSIGQPLTAGRSIAVDPEVVPLGAVAYMDFPMIQADERGRLLGKEPVRRLVLCQDTGGAIKGPGRVDVYVGHGEQARATAHKVWDKGELYILIKKPPPRQR